jgi:hypothetical protein
MRKKSDRGYHRHGMTGTKAWRAWYSMMQRCNDPRVPNYPSYGGRGIKVCDRWHLFENYYADVGERPAGMSLDRIDNNGDYGPDNWQWATSRQQAANRRNNYNLTMNGETLCIAAWSTRLGLHPATIRNRLRRGATTESALQPVRADRRLSIPIHRSASR